jgi:glycosyltransferase involved in cell wall biosynthesis
MSFMVVGVLASFFVRRPDVVVATSPQFFTAVAGWIVGALKRRPFVFELGDLWPASIVAVGAMKSSRVLRAMERFELFLYHKASVVVALTSAFKRNLVSRGVPEEKIVVVINGVDLSRYQPQAPCETLINEWQLRNKLVVGYVGTHGMAHQLENVIQAAEILEGKSSVHFLFVGDGACKRELQSRALAANLSNVSFAAPRPKEDMPNVWSVCDIALIHLKDDPAFAEVIPSKMFEAMGMGKPLLLVSPVGEAKAILDSTGAGEWVPAACPDLLAHKIESLRIDKVRLAQLADASRKAASHYSRDRQASDMLRALNLSVRQYSDSGVDLPDSSNTEGAKD